MSKVLKWRSFVSAIIVISSGSLLHFTWEWSGHSTVVAVFAATNESTWEHLKLAFWRARACTDSAQTLRLVPWLASCYCHPLRAAVIRDRGSVLRIRRAVRAPPLSGGPHNLRVGDLRWRVPRPRRAHSRVQFKVPIRRARLSASCRGAVFDADFQAAGLLSFSSAISLQVGSGLDGDGAGVADTRGRATRQDAMVELDHRWSGP